MRLSRLIERPPHLFRLFFPGALFRIPRSCGQPPVVYLTFDDGPIPEATPEVLGILEQYHAKATFFMVGDNAQRYPALVEQVRNSGHAIGNHTMHHLRGSHVTTQRYVEDVMEADRLLHTTPLLRAPHGWLRQASVLSKRFRLVMYDLVTRDYSRHVDADRVLANVKQLARPGAIIVFHDSLKSIRKLRTALPASLQWLTDQGYTFGLIPTPPADSDPYVDTAPPLPAHPCAGGSPRTEAGSSYSSAGGTAHQYLSRLDPRTEINE